ncbi:MAG TPA: PTS sugar transporter subunit IIA [Candidatus Hydrogenedentes bacterium]|nr:PTS sugar transporter subunit IIA [Candidatus Hydrogenedentota bacterium]HOT49727.1 PTS sugar transporter subunit IIA [Candidatus Hydrogenedentota bacterium]HOV74485.1 PTS sugar transporter subunit IIA [Candidatus Hydrogenedentota bacterium]HPC17280.1 PTS sugar transporter subunit IIA [Candidatus Hydrogenedentota bacterium]HRT21195.1 PTS sugar transporter subunit IIA [Candidatus Hydrogenedentota bacterium]
MVLSKYIAKNCIVTEIAAANKSDAIKELTHLLFEKKKMKGMGEALDQVVAREVTESTGIGRGIAVPHARVTGIKQLVCAVGRVPAGLEFMSVDRKPVQLIFLIFYPPAQQTTYLNFVATVIKVLRDPKNMAAMMAAKTADDMCDILETASKSLNDNPESASAKLDADPAIAHTPDAHADLVLLARMQLYGEMLATAKTGKSELKQRIDKIRSLVDPRLLRHYDRLMKSQPPALVPVEGDTCQGCFMRLPSKFAQQVRQDSAHIHTCANCSRFIYVL